MLKFLPDLKKYKWWILVAVVGVSVGALTDLILPGLMSQMVDVGIKTGSREYIISTGLKMLITAVASLVSMVIAAYCTSRLGAGFSADTRLRIFSKIQTFGPSEMDQIGTASLITRNTNDVQQVQMFINMFIRIFVRAPIMMIGGIIMSYNESPRLALPLVFAVPTIVIIIFIISRLVIPKFSVLQEKVDTINRVLREQITGVRVVRAFNNEEHEGERFDDINKSHTKLSLSVFRTMQVMSPLLTIVMNITIVFVFWIASNDINGGVPMADGALIAVVQYIMQIMFSLIMLSFVFVVSPRAQASAERIHEILDTEPLIEDLSSTKNADESVKGKIEFRNVSFCFPGAEESTLRNINFTSKPGETTAIIGGTGSGKSTILQLVLRFYDVTQGLILVDDVDVRELSQEELREKIGFVPQRSQLFSGTIEENLRYGNEDLSYEDMEKAAKIAQALPFIEQRDSGFEAHVSQGATNFSGGQKQRLSIARAVARDPEIYLFDDSFSALDAETDLKVRTALKAETGRATHIIVAQRISSIMDADQILVLENGQVVGQGVHADLIRDCEVYREIALSQFSEDEVAV